MARFEKPTDPREQPAQRRRRHRPGGREPIPWKWLGLGILVTVASIWGALTLATQLLARPPLVTAGVLPTPTIIRLTAPPSPTASATPIPVTPTTIPTLTPLPTPDLGVAPPELTIGFYAAVDGTGASGVTIRNGPSTNNLPLAVAVEETVLLVVDGPETGSGLDWWQVEMADGTIGWVAADFIVPARAPDAGP